MVSSAADASGSLLSITSAPPTELRERALDEQGGVAERVDHVLLEVDPGLARELLADRVAVEAGDVRLLDLLDPVLDGAADVGEAEREPGVGGKRGQQRALGRLDPAAAGGELERERVGVGGDVAEHRLRRRRRRAPRWTRLRSCGVDLRSGTASRNCSGGT